MTRVSNIICFVCLLLMLCLTMIRFGHGHYYYYFVNRFTYLMLFDSINISLAINISF